MSTVSDILSLLDKSLMVPSMSLGEKEIEILQVLKEVFYDNTEKENQKFGGIKIDVLAKMVNLNYDDTFNKYRANLINCGYAEKPQGIDALLKITQDGLDYLGDMNNNKTWPTKWIMEHLWFPLLVALIAGFILLYFQPWQHNIQDNKIEHKADPR